MERYRCMSCGIIAPRDDEAHAIRWDCAADWEDEPFRPLINGEMNVSIDSPFYPWEQRTTLFTDDYTSVTIEAPREDGTINLRASSREYDSAAQLTLAQLEELHRHLEVVLVSAREKRERWEEAVTYYAQP
jgi:hypothetical protein